MRGRRALRGAGGATGAEQRGDAVDGGDADEPVDHAARRVGRAELLAEQPGDEIELGDRDEPPVEAADDQERGSDEIELLHGSYTSCRVFVQVRLAKVAPMGESVKTLYRYCMVTDVTDDRHLRIGELSRRSGVSPELLRAWERRYGLLRPERSSGGLRLYSSSDLERLR